MQQGHPKILLGLWRGSWGWHTERGVAERERMTNCERDKTIWFYYERKSIIVVALVLCWWWSSKGGGAIVDDPFNRELLPGNHATWQRQINSDEIIPERCVWERLRENETVVDKSAVCLIRVTWRLKSCWEDLRFPRNHTAPRPLKVLILLRTVATHPRFIIRIPGVQGQLFLFRIIHRINIHVFSLSHTSVLYSSSLSLSHSLCTWAIAL